MSEIIKNRSEILFIYDVTDANPNGDPADENKPRIDEETGVNIVTDVRLKRTIRDYLYDFKNQEIFVREERDNEEKLKTKETIYEEYGSPEKVIEKCIDIRLFGGTFALKKKDAKKRKVKSSEEEEPTEEEPTERAFALTGPVQFKFGRSLHRVGEPTFVRGTTVMPSGEKKGAGTFTEAYILPYSLIAFYGIVNENAAKDTGLTEADVELLLESIWNGTKNLISRSKFGQMPRLLLQVIFKETNYHIGELDHRIKLVTDKRHEEIRDISEVKLDVTQLVAEFESHKQKIDKIRYMNDKYLQLIKDGNPIEVDKLVSGITFEPLSF
ncbi:MAG TPA: type I-B CRISPR-associated protein Cas7/Csh2 [Geobacterales bacterium]|nr:type I-B CRISPR-associated protein Cas7/Csh2 [Geobacterales bacterium]